MEGREVEERSAKEKEPCWTKNEMSKDTDVMMKIGRKCPNPDFPFA